jgi:hypothetical protein
MSWRWATSDQNKKRKEMKLWVRIFDNVVRRLQSSILDLRHPDIFNNNEFRVTLQNPILRKIYQKMYINILQTKEKLSNFQSKIIQNFHFDKTKGNESDIV